MGKASVLILTLFMAGCTTTAQPVQNPREIWCEQNSPRRDATADTTRAEDDEIIVHNRKGVLWCGWKKP